MPRSTKKDLERMKDDFVWVLTHQLRTIVTPIKLFSDMLLTDRAGPLNEKQRSYMEDIHQAADRLTEIVRNLLNGYRIQAGEVELVYERTLLGDFIKGIVEEVRAREETDKCEVRLKEPEKELDSFLIDRLLTGQVLRALVYNAVIYSPKNRCTITVSWVADETKDTVTIVVADTGAGIPQKMQNNVFARLFRADNALKMHPEGLGFDLYLARLIMGALSGKIWFESELDKGTTFFISLPLHPKKDN